MQPIGTIVEKQTTKENENPEWRIDWGFGILRWKKREPEPPFLRSTCLHLIYLILIVIFKGIEEQFHTNRTGQENPI